MLYALAQEKTAFAVISHSGNEKHRTEDSEKENKKCDHCLRTGYTRDKWWKLHGRPSRSEVEELIQDLILLIIQTQKKIQILWQLILVLKDYQGRNYSC